MERIASEAGVSKQTLYRWWPTKGAVIMEALLGEAEDLMQEGADGGTLRTDLEAFIRCTVSALLGSTAGMMRGLMAEAQRDDGFAEVFQTQFIARRRAIALAIFARARDRGDIGAHLDLELLTDLTLGPIWYRVLTGQQRLDDDFIRELTTTLLRAAEGAS